jgi:dolichol-phosphate mannosyltransferase
MFGVLSDVIVAVNREQTRRIEELAAQLGRGGGRASTYRTGWNGTETDAERSVTAEGEGTAAEMGPESGSESPTTDR